MYIVVLGEADQMSTYNIQFYGEQEKIIPDLSSSTPKQIIWYVSHLEILLAAQCIAETRKKFILVFK